MFKITTCLHVETEELDPTAILQVATTMDAQLLHSDIKFLLIIFLSFRLNTLVACSVQVKAKKNKE